MGFLRGLVLAGVVVFGVSGCGGGGGEGAKSPTLSLSAKTINKLVSTDDPAPFAEVTATLSHLGDADFYAGWGFEGSGVSDFQLLSTNEAQSVATFGVYFMPPEQMVPGTYTAKLTVIVCHDEFCNKPFSGSPAYVDVTYTVTQGTRAPMSISVQDTVSASTTTAQAPPSVLVPVTINNPASGGIYLQTTYAGDGISYAQAYSVTSTQAEMQVHFYNMPVGVYSGTITLTACYDYSCARQAQGSPKQIAVTYTVEPPAPPPPDRAVLPTASVKSLAHDIVDAEFSASLNAVVMVSSYPDNALYLYRLADGTEQKLALDKLPTSVSVGPDGLKAAVGHDALITYVDLALLGVPGPVKTLLDVSTPVFDVVLAGNGWVHAFPTVDQWVSIHSVEVATNRESLSSSSSIRERTRAKLHPSGLTMYGANNGLSPDDVEKYDISSGPAAYLYDSPYHGTYPMCGNLWLSETGNHIYTACGTVLRSSTVQASDLVYAGTIPLSGDGSYYYSGYRITGLSQSEEVKQIALIEAENNCSDEVLCKNYYNLYESVFFNRTATYSIAPVEIAGRQYAQRGLFTFHSGDGQTRVLLSRLVGVSDPAMQFYLSVLQ